MGLDGRAAPAGALTVWGADGFFQVAALAGGDQPVRAGAGEVGLGAVPGIGQYQPDPAAGAAVLAGGFRACAGSEAVRLDEGGGLLSLAGHRLEPRAVRLLISQLGGDDQPVFAGHVLRVVALDEPAAADRHQPRVRVGDVPHRAGALAGRRPLRGLALRLGGTLPGRLELGLGLLDPAVVIDPGRVRRGCPAAAGLPGRVPLLQPGELGGPCRPDPGSLFNLLCERVQVIPV